MQTDSQSFPRKTLIGVCVISFELLVEKLINSSVFASNLKIYELRSNNNKLMLSQPKTNSKKRIFGYAAAKV